jgi:hypothetical protein
LAAAASAASTTSRSEREPMLGLSDSRRRLVRADASRLWVPAFAACAGTTSVTHPRGQCYRVSEAAVVNAGRISFGTAFILSSAFCTSGRMTTYFAIIPLARA